jgi:hypothetical protein
MDNGRFQHFLDDTYQPLVPYPHRPHLFYKLRVTNVVKESLYIDINNEVYVLQVYPFRIVSYRVFYRPVGAKSIAVFIELRLANWLKHLQNALLNDSVQYGRNAERSGSSVLFGYLDTSYGLWSVVRQSALHNFNELVSFHFRHISDCVTIHSGRHGSVIAFDIAIREQDIFFAADNFEQAAKVLALFTIGVQLIENPLHIVIFGVAQFLPPQITLLRLQHRHQLLSLLGD